MEIVWKHKPDSLFLHRFINELAICAAGVTKQPLSHAIPPTIKNAYGMGISIRAVL